MELEKSTSNTEAEDVRLRAACDRCHAQKVRCPRKQGEKTCDRCVKSGCVCVFSPFRQKKPMLEIEMEAQKPDEERSDDASRKRKRVMSQPQKLGEYGNIVLGRFF